MIESLECIQEICELMLDYYDLTFKERLHICKILANINKLKRLYSLKEKESD